MSNRERVKSLERKVRPSILREPSRTHQMLLYYKIYMYIVYWNIIEVAWRMAKENEATLAWERTYQTAIFYSSHSPWKFQN